MTAPLRTYQIVMKPHARGKRVWLQGAWLTAAGFAKGTPHNVFIDPMDRSMTIIACADGERKVAGIPERPIIDVIGAKVSQAFPSESATVTVNFGLIVVKG